MANELGSFIRQKRLEQTLNQIEFSERVGVKQQTVSRWESGHLIPPIERLPVIAKILGVTVEDLTDAAMASAQDRRATRDIRIDSLEGEVRMLREALDEVRATVGLSPVGETEWQKRNRRRDRRTPLIARIRP